MKKHKEHQPRDRVIYACEFPDGCAYVGLAENPKTRKMAHNRRYNYSSPAWLHKYNTGLEFEFKVLTGFMPEEEASFEEGVWKRKYELGGWTILNRAETGNLGGNSKRIHHDREIKDEELEAVPVRITYNEPECKREPEKIPEHILRKMMEPPQEEILQQENDVKRFFQEDYALLYECLITKVLVSSYRKLTGCMVYRWARQGCSSEECMYVRFSAFNLHKKLYYTHVRYKSVNADLKKDLEKVRLVLKPSKLRELIGVGNSKELRNLVDAKTLEHSMTKEQRRAINNLIRELSRLTWDLQHEAMKIYRAMKDNEQSSDLSTSSADSTAD